MRVVGRGRQIGQIDQIGLEFRIKSIPGSILDGMQQNVYPSKQEALAAVEIHTSAVCKPSDPSD